ncbi:TetR family transcriptional regulator [Erythrobacter insulae]|uniref:TetR family transcriptional regulator n=1 Tax=Erythrobacter insulae TaxID=2584124 RepID=A0A547PAB7_9SPHN|nr:TetR/AcrR family transcriptional regulator [Erythrobacter insulae]TRD11047.1 TetR family transcriptional regulator [Erythrobacter insulae]
MSNNAPEATREKLISVAIEEFAARGFHGASIAQIAGRLDLSKQALLYHFKRKEDLYAEVLKSISDHLLSVVRSSTEPGASPEDQFEQLILGFLQTAYDSPLETKVIMREILDNQRKDAAPEEWYLKTFLDAIIAKYDDIEGKAALPFAQKIAAVYAIISSIEFFSASGYVLKRFYGSEEFDGIQAAYREELRAQIRRMVVSS